jgi:hypothetical protein
MLQKTTVNKRQLTNLCLQVTKLCLPEAVLWIRTGFNADPDPAFYLNEEPDTDPFQEDKPMRIQADLNPGQTFKSQKFEILH